MTAPRYVLSHGGRWFYYLAAALRSHGFGGELAADGEPMEACERDGWWSCGHEASVITVTRRAAEVVTGYRLTDPEAHSARYPMTLTRAEWAERRGVSDSEDERLWHLYDRVTEPGEPVVEEITGPWLRLAGEPPAEGGREWRAELPYELSQRPEYLHLMPGYLPGFRDAMRKLIDAMPRVKHAMDAKRLGETFGLEVTVTVPYDTPITRYEPARNQDGSVSRSRRGRTVTATATRHLELAVPYVIRGPNRATAEAEWQAAEAKLVGIVEAASVAACSHCLGRGYVPAGSETYEKESKP